MQLNLNIDPQQINQMIVEAVLQSAIGDQIQTLVQAKVKEMASSYQNPFEPVVRNLIHQEIEKVIQEQYKQKIREFVAEKLNDAFLEDLFSRMWEKFHSKY